MILLTDTNMFIKYWRALAKSKKDESAAKDLETYKQVMNVNEIITCGVVRAELLYGATSEKNCQQMAEALSKVASKDLDGADWNELGHQLYKYRAGGFTVPFTDAVIASIGIKYGIPIWTDDKHFDMMQSVIPQLKVVRTEELIAPQVTEQ